MSVESKSWHSSAEEEAEFLPDNKKMSASEENGANAVASTPSDLAKLPPIATQRHCEKCGTRLGAQNPGTVCDTCKLIREGKL